MAIKVTNKEWCAYNNDYRCEYVMDSADDAANLPQSCPGSTAMVADETASYYMVNASGEWKKVI
jgi:hypothetical protein